MRKTLGLLICASALAASCAHAAPVTADISPDVVSADALPANKVSYPGGVTGFADVVYARMQGFRPLTLDIFTPGGAPKPLVIYVHGGGWTGGTSRNAAAFKNFPAVLADLASRGYVVASLNYRLAGEARFPAAANDVDAAIKWLKANAALYGIDKNRVAIWGGSAGGQLAGLAATDCAKAASGDDDCVQSAVIWYGVFDFATLGGNAPPPPTAVGPRPPGGPAGYLGCDPKQCADVAAKASPVTFIDSKDPPFLLIHGTDDKTVPYTQSEEMLAKLKAAGVSASLLTLPGFDHSFIGKTPELTREGHLKALQATFDFFDATLGKR